MKIRMARVCIVEECGDLYGCYKDTKKYDCDTCRSKKRCWVDKVVGHIHISHGLCTPCLDKKLAEREKSK